MGGGGFQLLIPYRNPNIFLGGSETPPALHGPCHEKILLDLVACEQTYYSNNKQFVKDTDQPEGAQW